ncbi:hypothetical protein FKG94_22440 [Exilibacterium tricleocarpae]|uniref:Uncharacterized protein n=1 Tax=Exilibacterium tricleocarpae TaxID=2591008 RepID=A0A545SY73_9GAMM|nr:hypothetical protein [Exilibacterium tricleocarpae]TQV69914.1 hypothetical protein FKG94_22440 [Exilibacterium tricleocarpae]
MNNGGCVNKNGAVFCCRVSQRSSGVELFSRVSNQTYLLSFLDLVEEKTADLTGGVAGSEAQQHENNFC